MKPVWAAAEWVMRVGRFASVVDIYFQTIDQIEWFKRWEEPIKTYSDPPRTLEELQSRVGTTSEPGYEDHHIEEQTLLGRLGYPDPYIDHPSNRVRIPTLKHYDVSGWYGTPNSSFGDLSPRDYLKAQPRDVRRQVGLDALIDFGVLKP